MRIIGSNFDQAEIARVAFELWEERGRPAGSPEGDWFRAEQLLRATLEPGSMR